MEVGFIGLTVAAFGILSDAAGKYTVAKVSMTTAALSLAYTCSGCDSWTWYYSGIYFLTESEAQI